MKRILIQIWICLCSLNAFASHIVGGEVLYKYLGSNGGTSKYQVSLRLFRDCDVDCGGNTNVACLPAEASISIFNAASPFTRVGIYSLLLTDSLSLTLTTYPSCIVNRPAVCYEVKTYTTTVSLPDNDAGYIIAYQDCCRAESINQFGLENTLSGIPGATYTADVPGRKTLPSGYNTSAVFRLRDTALICLDSRFSIDFSADDADGDSLSYAFAAAYDGGDFWSSGCTYTDLTAGGGCQDIQPAGPPPYKDITYNQFYGFSGTHPLGDNVSLNPATGIISGTVDVESGHYIVNVEVYEWRNHKVIASHRKDFIIRVEDCNIPDAKLNPFFLTCEGFNLSFTNNSNSPLIHSYYWDFGDMNTTTDTSLSTAPAYSYSDSGTYVVTLITNKGEECSDTATTLAKVYPGFIPGFGVTGGCITAPYRFTDLTTSRYGAVSSWRWDFGDFSTTADTAITQNPIYNYADTQQAQVRLIVGNTKGCIDTIQKIIKVADKEPLYLPFRDTLICAGDQLQLHAIDSASATTIYNWSPAVFINNITVQNPTVFPNTTTVYHVNINNNGCTNSDSVIVNVISFVTLDAGRDTTICLTDSTQLKPVTNALYFTWSPANSLSDATAEAPFAKPSINTDYQLKATVGHCSATDIVSINVVPYPQVAAGADTSVCFGKTAQLSASTNAPYFTWSPIYSLSGANTLTPVATPLSTTAYIITVQNTQGCTKPVSDTTIVTVFPRVPANAGNDTFVVANQPLQLNATGGDTYVWSPVTGMSNPYIANPVVTLGSAYDSVIYHLEVTTLAGCSASDDMKVVVFKTQPDIFVPTAFTPNGDGLNDRLRAMPVGIREFQYFRVFNRWGQMVFASANPNISWDGRVRGQIQSDVVFTWMARGIDYIGNVVERKGTLTLIR